jgi:PAS domain S-box-containing protein
VHASARPLPQAPARDGAVLPSLAALLTGAIAVLVLAGWATGTRPLVSVIPGGVAMQPWTAAAAGLGAIALLLGQGRAGPRPFARLAALAAGAVAIPPLLQYATGWDLGTDTLLFGEAVLQAQTRAVEHPGRMSGATALSLLLISAALASARRPGLSVLLGLAGLSLPALALLGHAAGIDPLAGLTFGHPISLPTAIAFSLLAAGTVAAGLRRPSGGGQRIATLLLGLVLAALLPAIAVGLAAVLQAAEGRRAQAVERLRDTARGLAIAVDAELQAHFQALGMIAASRAFDEVPAADPGPAQEALVRARQVLGLPVALIRTDATLLLHSDLPPGGPMPALRQVETVRRAVETARPVVVSLGTTALTPNPTAGLILPVERDGRVIAVLGMRLEPERLRRLLVAQRTAPGGFLALTDANRVVVARSDAMHATMLGRRIPEERDATLSAGEEGVYRAVAIDGTDRIFAFQHLEVAPGWTVAAAMPAAALATAAQEPLAAVLRGGLVALILGALLALLAASRILRPLRRLEAHARAIAAGESRPVAAGIAGVTELETLRQGFAAAEAALRARAAALEQSEERFRLASEASQGLLYDFDPVANHAVRLGAVEEVLGFRPEEIAPTREGWMALIHPDDLAGYRAAAATVFRGHAGRFEAEYRLRHRDGRWVSVWHRATALRDASGAVRRVVGNIVDVTARRAAEAALAESEARFRTMADGAPVPIWVNGPDGGCLFVNDAYLAFFGRSLEEVLGFGWTPSAHPEDRNSFVHAYFAAVAARGPFEAEARFRNAAGEYRWTLSRGMPRIGPDGAYLGHVGITIDRHDQRLAETELAEKEARLRLATEGAGVGIWRIDLLTGRGEWSREAVALFGSPRAEFDAGDWVEAVHPADRPRAAEAWRRAVEGSAAYEVEFRAAAPAPDGGERWLMSRGRVERDPASGRPLRGSGVLFDVTARVRAEALLRMHREELERLVEARTAALQRAAEEQRRAEEAMRQGEQLAALGRLTGGVAHDFNNLLQVVTSGAALLRRDLPEPRRARVLDAMADAGAKARDLTSRLLSFARRQALRPAVFDLNARLSGMTELLRRTLGSRVRVEVELAEGLPPVLADPGQLEIAVINLATNARDAMPDGGRLTLRTRREWLPAGVERAAGDYACLDVEDTGEGMTQAVRARIFEPFFTTKESGKGTGLGLAQVFGFARQSGGDIAVESEPGQGTRFTIHLPLAATGTAPSAPSPAGEGVVATMRASAGRVVLVVEDNLEAGEFAAALLEELGYRTRRAADVAEALAMLEDGARIDAVFSDVVMPGSQTGLDLAQWLRQWRPEVAVVLTSGYSARLAEGGTPSGVEVLGKPYRLDELAGALARAFARMPESATAT